MRAKVQKKKTTPKTDVGHYNHRGLKGKPLAPPYRVAYQGHLRSIGEVPEKGSQDCILCS